MSLSVLQIVGSAKFPENYDSEEEEDEAQDDSSGFCVGPSKIAKPSVPYDFQEAADDVQPNFEQDVQDLAHSG